MKTINHECYVDLEVAKLLKEAGFDWECEYAYIPSTEMGNVPFKHLHNRTNYNGLQYEVYSAPTLDVAQRWLREVKGIHICVKADAASINCKYFVTVIISDTKWGNVQDENMKTILFNTYEEAQEAGIQKCLTLLLNEDK